MYFGDQALVRGIIGKYVFHTVGSIFILMLFSLAMQFNLKNLKILLIFLIVVEVQLSPFSPHLGPLPIHKSTPFGLVQVSFIHVP